MQSGMSIVQSLILFAALSATGGIGLMFVGLDEHLDRTTLACLRQAPPPPPEENLFYAVLGLNASPGLRAVDYGRAAALEYQSVLEARLQGDEPFEFNFPGQQVASEIEIRRLCDPLQGGCPAAYVAGAKVVQELVSRNEALLSNYRDLPQYESFVMTLTPNLHAPVFPAGHLVMAQRLLHAQAVLQLANGEVNDAAAALVDDFAISRLLLAESDNLVYKMVAAALMARSLQLLSQIADYIAPLPDEISELEAVMQPLRAKELSLASPLCGEFRLLASVFLRPDAIVRMTEADDIAFGFLTRLAYKPNTTVNFAFRDLHTTLEKLDALPHQEFVKGYPTYLEQQDLVTADDTLSHFMSWPWNPVGNILISASRPAYGRWYARLYDLEGLRRLVVMKLLVRKHALGDEQLAQLIADRVDGLGDPYLDQPLVFDAKRRILRFHTLSQRENAPGQPDRWEVTLPVLPTPVSVLNSS